jgi:hypothetical protein
MPYGSDDYRSYRMDSNQKALEKLLRKAKDYRDEQAEPVRQPEPLPSEPAAAPKSDSDTIALLKRVLSGSTQSRTSARSSTPASRSPGSSWMIWSASASRRSA